MWTSTKAIEGTNRKQGLSERKRQEFLNPNLTKREKGKKSSPVCVYTTCRTREQQQQLRSVEIRNPQNVKAGTEDQIS